MKTDITKRLEHSIWQATHKQGTFCCFEVTIGWFGNERVDYLTYDTKGIFRCYEIKCSKSDFHSKAKKTFIGHYNYYVMPKELYEEVKEEIPSHIGVYVGGGIVKRAKKQELQVDTQILKDSFIRSLYREAEKLYKSNQPSIIENKDRTIARLERENRQLKNHRIEMDNILFKKFGSRWRKELEL